MAVLAQLPTVTAALAAANGCGDFSRRGDSRRRGLAAVTAAWRLKPRPSAAEAAATIFGG